MNYSDYKFTLDIQIHQAQVSIPVTLGDTARQLCIGFTDGRKPYYIADGCRAVFSAKKPDGTTIFNDCIIYNNTTIVYEFSKNTTSCEGIVDCEIRLYDADGKELTSPQFIIVVDKKVMRDEEVAMSVSESTTIANMVTAELQRVNAENARVTAEYGRVEAENARVAAENARVEAENERIASDEARGNKETARNVAENGRITAEEARVVAENLRAAAEEARAEAFDEAVGSEAVNAAIEELVKKAISGALDIANDLETDDPDKALSAAQGVVLKGLVDALELRATRIERGYYNGTGTFLYGEGLELTFSFAPKLILIFENIITMSANVYNTQTRLGVLVPDKNIIITDGKGSYFPDEATQRHMSLEGNTFRFSYAEGVSFGGDSSANVFNYKSYRTKGISYQFATEADNRGYWYYAIG